MKRSNRISFFRRTLFTPVSVLIPSRGSETESAPHHTIFLRGRRREAHRGKEAASDIGCWLLVVKSAWFLPVSAYPVPRQQGRRWGRPPTMVLSAACRQLRTSLARATGFLAHARKSAGLNLWGGCGFAPSIMRPTTMLAAWTSNASLIGWYWGGAETWLAWREEASLATCAPQA
jgi:hypothetical protein